METIDQLSARRAYAAVCAKLGEPDAANARASGSMAELHNARKAVRRLINKVAASTGPNGEPEELEAQALAHASNLVERISGTINALGGFDDRDIEADDKVMRTAADFRAHYLPKGQPDEHFGIADFLRGVAGLKAPQAVRNALSEGTNSAGGYALPSIVMPGILEALVPVSSVLTAGAGIVPIDMGAKSYTTAAVNTVPSAAWRLESGTVAQSDPTFRAVVAAPHSLSFYFKVSRELLTDANNIGPALTKAIVQAFAKELDRVALRGSGTAPQPTGLLNTIGLQQLDLTAGGTISYSTGTSGNSILFYPSNLNVIRAAALILTNDGPMPTTAIMSATALGMNGMQTDGFGQPLRRPDFIKDVRYIGTSQIPNTLSYGGLTNTTEIYVGSFDQLHILMRDGMSIMPAPQLFAGTGEVAFFCHCRADIAVMYPAAFTVLRGIKF